MKIAYAPGGWNAVIRSGTLIILAPGTGQTVIENVWESMAEVRTLEAALRAVTSSFGADITGMPPFAVVSLKPKLHLVVRGQINVLCRSGEQTTTVSGAHVSTWNEQVLDDQESLEVRFDVPAQDELHLPIEAGVVSIGRLVAGLAGSETGAAVLEAASPLDGGKTISPADLDAEEIPDVPEDPTGPGDESHTLAPTPDEVSIDSPEPASAPSGSGTQPEVSQTTGYDHLWDQTVLRRVEDAAVRVGEDEEDVGEHEQGAEAKQVPEAEAKQVADAGAKQVPDAGGGASAAGRESAREPATGPTAGLIDSVPWAKPRSAAAEETDHDGHTVMRSELADPEPPAPGSGTNAGNPATAERTTGASAAKAPGTGPMVLARLCPAGHANPPTNANCSTCGNAITSEPQQTRRPSLGTMRISNGDVVELERSVIVGRQPSVSRVLGNVMPRMVQVRSDDGDISRSHVEVRLEDWHVMLCDLNSTNGTFLIREGQPPRRLGPGEQTMLLDGDVAELGDNVWLRFEALQ